MSGLAPFATPLRAFSVRFVNPVARRFAGVMPWFGILTYPGRTSGRIYHTPLNVFRDDDHYRIVLTYGADTQWVRNVIAAGGCELRTRGRTMSLVEPELLHDPKLHGIPWLPRMVERANRATQVLRLRVDDELPMPPPA